MPEWTREIVLTLVTAAIAGIAWLFKGSRDDRIRREAAQQTTIEKLEARNEKLQGKVESLLADANARLLETDVLRAERIVLDKQFAALVTAMTAALERAEATIARMKDGR